MGTVGPVVPTVVPAPLGAAQTVEKELTVMASSPTKAKETIHRFGITEPSIGFLLQDAFIRTGTLRDLPRRDNCYSAQSASGCARFSHS